MKTKLILFIVVGALLSSCAGKFGVMKRRYNKGYYVSVSKKQQPAAKSNNISRVTNKNTETVNSVTRSQGVTRAENTQALPVMAAAVKKQQKNRVSDVSVNSLAQPLASASEIVTRTRLIKSLPTDLRKAVKQNKAPAAGTTNTVVLVILCLLIPPLAVYLFQDAITIDFWVDLILSFLFWLPGVVFAFLVCFGGVSLA